MILKKNYKRLEFERERKDESLCMTSEGVTLEEKRTRRQESHARTKNCISPLGRTRGVPGSFHGKQRQCVWFSRNMERGDNKAKGGVSSRHLRCVARRETRRSFASSRNCGLHREHRPESSEGKARCPALQPWQEGKRARLSDRTFSPKRIPPLLGCGTGLLGGVKVNPVSFRPQGSTLLISRCLPTTKDVAAALRTPRRAKGCMASNRCSPVLPSCCCLLHRQVPPPPPSAAAFPPPSDWGQHAEALSSPK